MNTYPLFTPAPCDSCAKEPGTRTVTFPESSPDSPPAIFFVCCDCAFVAKVLIELEATK